MAKLGVWRLKSERIFTKTASLVNVKMWEDIHTTELTHFTAECSLGPNWLTVRQYGNFDSRPTVLFYETNISRGREACFCLAILLKKIANLTGRMLVNCVMKLAKNHGLFPEGATPKHPTHKLRRFARPVAGRRSKWSLFSSEYAIAVVYMFAGRIFNESELKSVLQSNK